MEKIIFFGLVIPIFIFVIYLGVRAIMTGSSAKSANKLDSDNENVEEENSLNNSENLSKELNNLNKLLKSGVLTKEEFEKAKKKILND
tara:strand:+ start:1443 stop:1706 length:264 start_codon:yes stop_codon:yes gene_type:complete